MELIRCPKCRTPMEMEIIYPVQGKWYCPYCGEVIHTEGSWEKPEKKYCSECGIKMEIETNEETFD